MYYNERMGMMCIRSVLSCMYVAGLSSDRATLGTCTCSDHSIKQHYEDDD
jgi:hypothetical protein